MTTAVNPPISLRKFVFVSACFVVFICAAANVFTVFAIPLQEATGGTASQVALTLTLYQTSMAVFGILSGRITDKVGAKMLTYVGGFVFALGWFLTAQSTNIPMLYISYGLIAGAGNGLLYNPAINVALRWYPEKRGTMMGVLLCSVSVGAMLMARGGALLSDQFGTRGLLVFAAAFLVLSWSVGWRMVPPPQGWKPPDWKPADTGPGAIVQREYSPGQMLRTGTFWVMIVLFAISCTAGMMMIGSLSGIAQTQLGMTAVVASNMVAVNAIANFVGRLGIGRLCDRIGETQTLALILVATVVGLLGLRASTNLAMFVVFLALLGASFGGVLVVFPPLTSKAFGISNFGVNYGVLFFGYAGGALIGPQIAARVVDPDVGAQAYSTAYLVAAGVAVLGLVLNLVLMRIQRTTRAHALAESHGSGVAAG